MNGNRGAFAIMAYVVGGGLIALGGSQIAHAASANVSIDNGLPGVLTLESGLGSGWHEQLEPGDSILWPVTTVLGVAETGELSVTIEHEGVLTDHEQGLSLRLEACDVAWEGDAPTCTGGADLIVDGTLASIASGTRFPAGEIGFGTGPHFLATLWLPEVMPTGLQGQDGSVALGFTALGDSASVTVPGELPRTGLDTVGAVALCVGLVVVGLTLARQYASGGRGRP